MSSLGGGPGCEVLTCHGARTVGSESNPRCPSARHLVHPGSPSERIRRRDEAMDQQDRGGNQPALRQGL